jgi:hypothetical protein
MISYEEHKAWLGRQMEQLEAEYQGFLRAKIGSLIRWHSDEYIQARFEKGYQDGQAKLLQDSILTTKAPQEDMLCELCGCHLNPTPGGRSTGVCQSCVETEQRLTTKAKQE